MAVAEELQAVVTVSLGPENPNRSATRSVVKLGMKGSSKEGFDLPLREDLPVIGLCLKHPACTCPQTDPYLFWGMEWMPEVRTASSAAIKANWSVREILFNLFLSKKSSGR